MEGSVKFRAVDFPEANELTVHILSAVAQHERKMISQRTKDALHAAKARGKKLGGDRGHLQHFVGQGARASATVRSRQARARAGDLLALIQPLILQGKSLRAIAGELNARNIPAARGGKWQPTQVQRVMSHANAD
jgi:DNA invertase Pin-like site-specific DNA recombinase